MGAWMDRASNAALLRRARIVTMAACLTMSAPTWAAAQDECESLKVAFSTALTQADLPRIVSVGRQVRDSTCPAPVRRDVGRKTALAHLREASRTPTLTNAAALKLLETGAQFDQPWQLMAAIGDLRNKVPAANGTPDRAAASRAYQAALEDIANPVTVPQPPQRDVIERIVRLAQQTRAAASVFVRGDILMSRAIREIAIEEVPVPVEFVRDSDEFTARGRQAAEDAARLLAEQNRPRILMTGHTDPDGSDQYNLDLSVRRAQAFKRFLVEKGYSAASIETAGQGKLQPLRIENESNYAKDELYQMQRRVDVKFR